MDETIAASAPQKKTVELKAITKKLTEALISSTAAASYERVELRDSSCPGLSLRISGSSARRLDGTKAWSFVYRVKGESAQRRIGLGHHPGVTLKAARELAEEHRRMAQGGIDPQAKRAAEAQAFNAEQAKTANRKTVQGVLKEYLAHGMSGRAPTYVADVTSKFARLVFPTIGDRFVDEIEGQDISELVGKVRAGNGPVAANRLLTAIKAAFNWTTRERSRWLKVNPADNLQRTKEASESRPLTDVELPFIWKAADRLGYPCGDALRLMLLTGQRRGDVGSMRFKHLDLDAGTWTQPAWVDRAAGKGGNKARRQHHLPLPPAAVELLKRLKAEMATHPGRKPGADHVFVDSTGKPLQNAWHTAAPKLRELADGIAAAKLDRWVVEYARHTVKTGLQRVGAEEIVSELVLNHAVSDKLSARYGQHDYLEEMRGALARWERRLLAIVEPADGKVVALPRAAG